MKKRILLISLVFTFFMNLVYAQEIMSTEKLPELVIKGKGEINLLLIPCMSCRWNEWEEFMDRNIEKYKMYAITIPGYGGTPIPNLPMNTKHTPWRDNALNGLSELIDQYELDHLTVIGHSWGSMLAIQLASIRKDVISKVISIDGSIESTSWVPLSKDEKLVQADNVIQDYTTKLSNAEEWSKFNGASVGNALGNKDSITTETMNYRIKLLTSFMATNRNAMLQYWRENLLIDLTKYLKDVSVPILDIQSFSGNEQKKQKEQYLNTLKACKAPSNVTSLIMYDTKHFIMYHRPLKLDCIIQDFISGKELVDFAPKTSEYFKEEIKN